MEWRQKSVYAELQGQGVANMRKFSVTAVPVVETLSFNADSWIWLAIYIL